MVRQTPAAQYEGTPRPVIAIGNDYPDDHVHPAHRHRRSQLLYGARGTMIVDTEHGRWVVPPQQGVWIPAGILHGIRMLGRVTTRSLYVEREAAAGLPGRGVAGRCQVVGVSPLFRALLLEAVDLPLEYAPASRAEKILSLLLDEIREAPILPLSVPFPADERLARLCRRFVAEPSPHATIEEWSRALGMSRRAFTRFFKRQLGLGCSAWQRRATLVAALPRLAAGEAVTIVALDLGYASPAAFSSMFKQALGFPPSACRAMHVADAIPGAGLGT